MKSNWNARMVVAVIVGGLAFCGSMMGDLERDDRAVLSNVTVRRVQIDVDYDVPVSQMIVRGKYHASHHEYTDRNFPIEQNGRKRVDVYLLQFDRKMSGNEVWERVRALGFYSASVFDLLTLGAQYPDVQRGGAMFCLGYELNGVVPFLGANRSGQRLAWILHAKRDYVYPEGVWFAVLKLE